MAGALRLLLCTALLATARAVTYGELGVGSQYQLFGRPIIDTSAIHSRSTVLPGQMPAQVLAVEGDVQRDAAKAVGTGAAAKQKCEGNLLYSEVFGKCLPAPGKDGYIGPAEHDSKGKALPSHSAFAPIDSATADVHMSLPLRAIPMQPLPLRMAALNREPQLQPVQPPSQLAGGGLSRAVAPAQQLRLACPAGFTYQPAMGACIAPASSFGAQQPQQAMRRRDADDDDDDDDDNDDDDPRRGLIRRRMRHHMFGRRRFGGGPRVLAPVFVFVLPPNALDRNATMRLGKHFGRVHEVHPSFVGARTGDQRTAPGSVATTSGPAAAETPTTKPGPSAPVPTPVPAPADKAKGAPAATDARTGTDAKALRGAFVNPIVTDSSGESSAAQPLMSEDKAVPSLHQRAEFISPFVAQQT